MSVVVLPDSSASSPSERTIDSRVLGDLLIPATSLFAFPEGLHGFETHREFALVPAARDGFWWLQATDEAQLAFLLVDPFQVSEDYELDLVAGDIRFLGLEAPDDALALTIVTLPAQTALPATTNLRGPLIFNTTLRRGRQVVSTAERYGLQVPIPLATSGA